MTSSNLPGDGFGDFDPGPFEDWFRRMAADPTNRIMCPGSMLGLASYPIEHGQAVEFAIAPETGGDLDLWLTPDKARELAAQLWASADDADRLAADGPLTQHDQESDR